MRQALSVLAVAACISSCAGLQLPNAPWQGIADVAPAPMLPLSPPTTTMRGERGPAPASYPPSFAVTMKADGTISLPDNTAGKLKGASVVAGGSVLATVTEAGDVSGSG